MYKRNCFLLASLHAYKEHIPIHSTAVKIHPKLNLWDWAGWRGGGYTHNTCCQSSKFHWSLQAPSRAKNGSRNISFSMLSYIYQLWWHFIFTFSYYHTCGHSKKRMTFTNLIIGIIDFYFGRFQRFTCRITSRRET